MRRLLNAALLIGALAGLCACANHTFAPGPGMSAGDYGPDAARCRLFTRGSDPSFSFDASGSPKFVAGAMAGAVVAGAIATAVRENANFNDCMEARGWRIADNAQPAAATTFPGQGATPTAVTTLPVQGAAPAAATTSVAATNSAVQGAAPPAATTLAVPDGTSRAPDPPPAARRNLGIRASNVTDSLAYSSQLDPPRGLVVIAVMQDGAASAARLQTGDVILSFGATPLMTVADLQRVLTTTAANSAVPVQIWRDRQELAANLQF
jgi:S1-C subfamily serine protease